MTEPQLPRLPSANKLYQGPDYIDDPDGLERWRQAAIKGRGHDMAPININTLRRLIDTIERLRAALAAMGE